MDPTIGYGITLTKGGTAIAKIKNIEPPELSRDEADVTVYGSADGYKEAIPGLKDGGEVELELIFDSGDAGQLALATDFESGATSTYVITFPAAYGVTWTFTAWVKSYKHGLPLEEGIGANVSLRVTGKPVLGTSASTGISAFILRNSADGADATNDAYTPAIAAGSYFYTVTFDTDTSVRPKCTAASHTLKLYINDVYSETLTTAVSGTAIAFSAGETKKLTIIAYEAGKTPKVYQFMVTRTA